jgi:hypothetical protein
MNNWRKILWQQLAPDTWQEYYARYGAVLEKQVLKLLRGEDPKRNLQNYIKHFLVDVGIEYLSMQDVGDTAKDIYEGLYEIMHPFER